MTFGWPLPYALGCVGVIALAATARHTLVAVRISPALAEELIQTTLHFTENPC